MNEFWLSCVNHLEQDFPPQQISAWIRPLVPLDFNESEAVLRLSAPNRFKLDWVKKNFSNQIEQYATDWFKKPVRLHLELQAGNDATNASGKPNDVHSGALAIPAGLAARVSENNPAAAAAANEVRQESVTAVVQAVDEKSRLNTDLTFETFVTGKANQLARAAALQVAENPGVSYNPLFLYGGVGLGKTHLIHAVGNAMMQAGLGKKVRYVHADQYVSDVVKAYQRKAFDDFKRYYHSLDLLLIDDIQFFSGKNRTQEEFFYAFEAMVAQRKQIIITSDTYPKELAGIDSRLISRFDSGLTVAIEPPELEMRVAILISKAQAAGVVLPDEVAFFIAKRIRSNVRELEGALRRVIANARFTGQPITLDFAKEALKDLLTLQARLVTLENIQKTVADYYKVRVADLLSQRRNRSIARPRQVAMTLAKELTQHSLPEIGDAFGGRDHTTVMHACKRIKELQESDQRMREDYSNLLRTLTG